MTAPTTPRPEGSATELNAAVAAGLALEQLAGSRSFKKGLDRADRDRALMAREIVKLREVMQAIDLALRAGFAPHDIFSAGSPIRHAVEDASAAAGEQP